MQTTRWTSRNFVITASPFVLSIIVLLDHSGCSERGTPTALVQEQPTEPFNERFAWQPKKLLTTIGTHRGRHWGRVHRVALSPDGKWVASGGSDGAIRLWDVATLREVAVMRGRKDRVMSVTFSPDSHTLAAGGNDGAVRLWDLTGELPKLRATLEGHETLVSLLTFSPDGKLLAAGGFTEKFSEMPSEPPSIVRLWDLTAKKPTAWAVLKSGGVLLSSAFSADGNTLAWITHSYKRLLDLRSIKPEERNVNVSELQSTALDKLATTVAFSPDGKMLAWGNREGVVEIRELGGIMSKIRAKFHAHKSAVRSLTFSQNGTMLASTSPDGVRLWDRNGKRIRKRTDLQVKLTVPVSVAFLSDGTVQVAAIGSDRKTLRLWNLDGNQAEERTAGNKLRRLIEFSSDGKTLAVCSEDGSVEFWDLQGPQPTRRAEIEGPKQTVLAMVFAADDTLKVASTIYGKGILQVWDLAAGKHPQLVATLQGYRGHVSFAPDQKSLASGGWGYTASLWNLSGKHPLPVAVLKNHDIDVVSLAYAPDGQTLASVAVTGPIRLWDLTQVRQLST